MENNSVKVEIFGKSYTINGDATPEYILKLADHVHNKMEDISANITSSNPTQVAILAALNIADEYFQLKNMKMGDEKAVLEKASNLISMLDEGIIGDLVQGQSFKSG